MSRVIRQEIYQAVQREPGLRQAEIARRIGRVRSTVCRQLPLMDREGLLLYEQRQRLYVFKR